MRGGLSIRSIQPIQHGQSCPHITRGRHGAEMVFCVPCRERMGTELLHQFVRAQAPALCNLRHPERTQPYQTIAEHFETWLELASAGQFDGQGDHRTPRAFVLPKRFANTSNVASLHTVLRMPAAATVAMTASSPIPAKAGQTGSDEGASGVVPVGKTGQTQPEPAPPKRSPARYLWAVLIARI